MVEAKLQNMKTTIIGFRQDEESHWVADLACGHSRHFRHDPPWQVREWVVTREGRERLMGSKVECKKCEEETYSP